MTLNITIVSAKRIFQCADYQTTDFQTGAPLSFRSQKVLHVLKNRWHASVCFSGIANWGNLDVSLWLREKLDSLPPESSFNDFLAELALADQWLVKLPKGIRLHSFSVGAFVEHEPVFALLSNYENLSGPLKGGRIEKLQTYITRERATYISGQRGVVDGATRRSLLKLAEGDSEPDTVLEALATANQRAALKSSTISAACFVNHLDVTGRGGARAFGIDIRTTHRSAPFAQSALMQAMTHDAFKDKFGPGGAVIKQMAYAKFEPTEKFHLTQIRERADSAEAFSNYGVYLQEQKKDLIKARIQYEKAISLDATHVNAYTNLGNLHWEIGELDEAETCYTTALSIVPDDEPACYNYARFLYHGRNNRSEALNLAKIGMMKHPESGRLMMVSANCLLEVDPEQAIKTFARARDLGAEQREIECGYAVALHLAGRGADECIAAYQVALSLGEFADLRINLAQMLFRKGLIIDARRELQKALGQASSDEARLEGNLYLVGYLNDWGAPIEEICRLISNGLRLNWNLAPDIEILINGEAKNAGAFVELIRELNGQSRSNEVRRIAQIARKAG